MKTTRLPNSASKQEIAEQHLIKMHAKKIARQRLYQQMQGPTHIRANLSVNHPDYGMSPQEHLAEKANRATENSS